MIKKSGKFKVNPKRELMIYTWGTMKRQKCPYPSQYNFNLCGVQYIPQDTNVLLTKTGMDKDIQNEIFSKMRFRRYLDQIVRIIEEKNLKCISINCYAGLHRSVSMANMLKNFYPKATVSHIELGIDIQ